MYRAVIIDDEQDGIDVLKQFLKKLCIVQYSGS